MICQIKEIRLRDLTFPWALWNSGTVREQGKENYTYCHPRFANTTFTSAEPSLSLQIPKHEFQQLLL